MTEAVTISLIGAVCTFAVAAFTAIVSLANNTLARRSDETSRRNEVHITEAKQVIVTLEKNTNSIKDALITTTKAEAFEKATRIERQRGEDIAAAVKEAQTPLSTVPQQMPQVVARQEKDSKE